MAKQNNIFTLSRIMFILSVCTIIYWLLALNVNVYQYAVVGAIFEMTSLLFLVSLYALPILLIGLVLRLKARTPKLHFVSLVMLLITLIVIFTVYQ